MKLSMIDDLEQLSLTPHDTKESVAYTRYADYVFAENKRDREILQFPSGEPERRNRQHELFKIQKTPQHWEEVSRSKSYIAKDFFPPV